MYEEETIVLDVYNILDQLGISREAVQFLNVSSSVGADEATASNVLPE